MDELSSIIFINCVFGVNLLYINNDKNTSIVMFQKYRQLYMYLSILSLVLTCYI